MARPRRTSRASTSKTTATPPTDEFTCPECGKTFTRAAALGAHRSRAHGVAGASKRARPVRQRAAARATGARTASRSRRATVDGAGNRVDRDALLQALFPNGLPAREAVIRAANAWLNQAEQLAKMK